MMYTLKASLFAFLVAGAVLGSTGCVGVQPMQGPPMPDPGQEKVVASESAGPQAPELPDSTEALAMVDTSAVLVEATAPAADDGAVDDDPPGEGDSLPPVPTDVPGTIEAPSILVTPASAGEEDTLKTQESEAEEEPRVVERSTVEGWRIQIMSLSTSQRADQVAREAERELGYPAYIQRFSSLYHVRVGDFTTRSGAMNARKRIQSMGYRDAFPVRTRVYDE